MFYFTCFIFKTSISAPNLLKQFEKHHIGNVKATAAGICWLRRWLSDNLLFGKNTRKFVSRTSRINDSLEADVDLPPIIVSHLILEKPIEMCSGCLLLLDFFTETGRWANKQSSFLKGHGSGCLKLCSLGSLALTA